MLRLNDFVVSKDLYIYEGRKKASMILFLLLLFCFLFVHIYIHICVRFLDIMDLKSRIFTGNAIHNTLIDALNCILLPILVLPLNLEKKRKKNKMCARLFFISFEIVTLKPHFSCLFMTAPEAIEEMKHTAKKTKKNLISPTIQDFGFWIMYFDVSNLRSINPFHKIFYCTYLLKKKNLYTFFLCSVNADCNFNVLFFFSLRQRLPPINPELLFNTFVDCVFLFFL